MGAAEDRLTVEAVLLGDKEAFGDLVRRYQGPIFNLMLRGCGSREEAGDLTQETFIKAYERLESFNRDRAFFTWLYSIGVNHLRDYLRRVKAGPVWSDEDPEMESVTDEPEMTERLSLVADAHWLVEALKVLPLDYREAVTLRYREELSMGEVAEALGLSLSGAKMRVHRGLDKLRRMWREESHGKRKKDKQSRQ